MANTYTKDQTLDDIKKRHKEEDKSKYAIVYKKADHNITEGNDVWNKDLLRSGVERYFLLKNEIMREIMESYGEYVGEIDYGKNCKITFKSDIKDDKEDWNADFTAAFLANFGGAALGGEFPLPAAIINYLKSLNANGMLRRDKVPMGNQKAKYEQAILRVEEFVKNGLPEYTALAITGMTYTEDSWASHGVVNEAERRGGGIKGTGGVNAGEGMIGITFAPMKKMCITKAGFWGKEGMGNPNNFAGTYNFGISKLDTADSIKIVIAYYQCNGKWSHALLTLQPTDELNQTIICCAAYRSKSSDTNYPGGSDPNQYVSHTEHGASGAAAYRNHTGYEGFSAGIITAYLLAKVIKAKNEGNSDWKKVTDDGMAELEGVIGKF